ncbi:MAG TPA: hypothetical protein VNT79_12390 [Phycisphaerae bacterium]|nr:hypothetical protein [Phycisphaerae bacterium]
MNAVQWTREQIRPGTPFVKPDPIVYSLNHVLLRHPAVTLGRIARITVHETIHRHCQIRKWTLHGANVRTNHVHVVLTCNIHPDIAREQFKAWCTRILRERGEFPKTMNVWTEGGSDRWLWDARSLRMAIDYISEQQGADLD